jgi:hypothetical protein
VVFAPEDTCPDFGMFLGTSEGVAFAGIAEEDDEDEGTEQNTISIWTLSDSDLAVWSFTNDIDLEVTLPAGAIQPAYIPKPVGFVEGESTICIDSGEMIFTVEVGSLETKDIGSSARSLVVLPFVHFYMPSLPKVFTKQFFTSFLSRLLQLSNLVCLFFVL